MRPMVPSGGGWDVAALRRAFDHRFAEAPQPAAEEGHPLLVVRREGRRVAVPLESVAAVLPCTGVAPVPGTPPGWLGLATTRMGPVAVHGLGQAADGDRPVAPPRWLLLVRGHEGLAAGCDEVSGLARGALVWNTSEWEPVRWDGDAVPVMDLQTLSLAQARGEGG